MTFKDSMLKGMNVLVFLIRVSLGCVFLYSGVEKIQHPQDFLATIYDFQLTGQVLGLLVAVVMPWLEVLLSFALLSGIFPGGALLASSGLGLLFLIIQASAILRGLNISCGCFGPDESKMIGWATFIRTFIIFSGAVLAWTWVWFCARRTVPFPSSLRFPGSGSDITCNPHTQKQPVPL